MSSDTKTIRDRALLKPENWQASLGLLPVFLQPSPGPEDQSRFVLLNGVAGNFCLDLSQMEVDTKIKVDNAWSCNVGFYISIQNELVDVVRWDIPEKTERYTLASVASNLSAFHHYLERNNPEWTKGIVTFYGRAFRRLRSCFAPNAGRDALLAYLYILACAIENRTELPSDALDAWALPQRARSAALSISPLDLESVLEHVVGIGAYQSLTPRIPLVIRHASGMIFQDAHRAAEQTPQTHLPGFVPEAALSRLPSSAIGVHFTPPTVARTLAEEAVLAIDLSKTELVVLDPACGSGELLKEFIRQLERRGFTGTLRLQAFDISPTAVDMARFSLAFERRSVRTFAVEYQVKAVDALSETWPEADLIIMNPPFLRWNDIDPQQQELLTRILGANASRHNLATAFLFKATTNLRNGGVLAAIAPKAFFESDAATEVRERVSSILTPRVIARLGSQDLFRDTLVDAGIYVGAKSSATEAAVAVWSDQTAASTSYALRALRRRHVQEVLPISEETHSIYRDEEIGRTSAPWAPRRYTAKRAIQQSKNNPKLIPAGRAFSIRQGARLGHDVFIVTREYWRTLSDRERRFFRPAVLNQSIRDGKLNDNLYAFFPHTDSIPVIEKESQLLELVPKYAKQYLIPNKASLKARKSLADSNKWWEMIRRREWQQDSKPKLVSKYFGGAGSFAWDETGDYVVVVGHAWLPKLNVDDPNAYGRFLTIYLNLPETEELIDALSVRVSGGQLDLSSKYLKDLPIPDLKQLNGRDLRAIAKEIDPVSDASRRRVRDLLGFTIP
jgi:hypothetical protein